MNKDKLPVIEIFGPTIQGEGALIGTQTHFVRLGGCDYKCSWCDSMHAVDPKLVKKLAMRMFPKDIVTKLKELPSVSWVTLSGGNPGMFNLEKLVTLLAKARFHICIETQGSIYQDWFGGVDVLTLSPKGPSANTKKTDFDVLDKCVKLHYRFGTIPKVVLKVVCMNEDDFLFAKEVHQRYTQLEMYLQVGNHYGMQKKSTFILREELLHSLGRLVDRTLADPEMQYVRVLPQMHVLIWGDRLGV